MPYIPPHKREALDPTEPGNLPSARTAGELNFQVTRLVDRFVKQQGGDYSAINEAIGALECAKLELYRRVAAPYENTKMQENGDVYS
jgi:hypothetical protein